MQWLPAAVAACGCSREPGGWVAVRGSHLGLSVGRAPVLLAAGGVFVSTLVAAAGETGASGEFVVGGFLGLPIARPVNGTVSAAPVRGTCGCDGPSNPRAIPPVLQVGHAVYPDIAGHNGVFPDRPGQ